MATISSGKLALFSLPFLLAGAFVADPARAQVDQSERSTVETSKISSDLPAVYQRWLDEEVNWIITPEERAEFTRLSANEDRNRFVEAFWMLRSPAGAPPNKYKEEHYRRLAYANQHFAAGVPGWETDRGRIYIVYGPPDWIKVQSATGDDLVKPKPTQLWHYSLLPGYGRDVDLKFVDICECGDYRLQTSPKN